MRDDEIRERLTDCNPWWRVAATGSAPDAWTSTDQTLAARNRVDLGYRSDVLDDIAEGPVDDKLVVLRGPRRVGKSVLLKDTAAQLCRRDGFDTRQLVYLAADGMRVRDLGRAIKLGRELTRSVGDARRVWLLDEVTGIPGWTEEIKFQREHTPLGDETVVCTGSSWDPEAEVERHLYAGRAGTESSARSRVLHPMSFRAVLAVTRRPVPPPPRVPPWGLQETAVRPTIESLEIFVDDLDLAWQAYLTSGGFPRAVTEHHRNGEVSDSFLHDLEAWLHQDVDPDAGADSVPKLLGALEQHCTSPLNRTTLAQDLGYATRQAFERRLQRLVRAFAALWCHQIDDAGDRVSGAQSKLYLADPLLAWVGPRLRSGLERPDFTRLTEAALGAALGRAIDGLEPGRWLADDTIGYARSGKGNQVDLGPVSVPSPSGPLLTVPLESKWVPSGWRSEARSIEAKFGRGILATRRIVDLSYQSWAVPAPVLALLLE